MPPLRRKPGPKSATTKPKDKKSPKIIKQSKRKSDNDDDDDPDDPDSISDLSEQDLKSDKEEDDVSITFSDFSDSSNGEHSQSGKKDLKGLSEKEKSFLESSDDDEDNSQPVKPSGPTNRPKPASSAKKNDTSNKPKPASAKKTETLDKPKPASAKKTETLDKPKPASAKKTETSDKPKPASAKKTETSDKPKPASAKKTETSDKPKPASAKKTETSDKPKPASAKKTETSDKPKPASANKENSSGKPNFSTSIKDNSENKMTPAVQTTVCEPIKLNQYYRHKCKLASVASSKQITGQDICKPGRAAELTMEKLKLHYVVHYLYRGTWDHLVPEEEPHLLGKIEYYLCNICNKRFKNHLEKKEYPGRGSVLCHLATDHGLLLDAMLNDECVDLKEDIQILSQIDNQFKDAVDNGSEISKMKLDQLVTAKDSMIWRLSQQKQKQGETNGAATPKVQTTNTNSSSSVSNSSSSATPNSPKHVEDSSLDKPTSNEEGDTKTEKSESVNRPTLLECPHCDELRGNDDAPNLRLHIFHHYKDHWLKKLDDISSDDNTYFCDRCPRKRKITGATLEGTKTAVVCHFAIQHYELRAVLEEDKTLQKNFVKELYWDHDNPNSSNSSYYQSQTKVIKSQAPARTPQSKRSAAMSSSEGDDVATSDLSSFEMSLSDSDGSVKKKKCNPTKRSAIKSNPQPGDVNPNYIRKRAKIDFTLDSDDDDTASDHSWKKSSSKKKVRSTRKKPASPTPNANELQKKARILPKRGATKNKNFSFLNEDDEDDE